MYYAELRPGETVMLWKSDCCLPPSGLGSITLARSRSEVKQWAGSGETHGERGLKEGPARAASPVCELPA
jgi:hypothetical protein